MRPQSIVLFERLFLTSMAVGVIATVVNWGHTTEALSTNPAVANFAGPMIIGSLAFGLCINALIYYFIAHRASNIARWIWTVFFVIGLIGGAFSLLGSKASALYGPMQMVLFVINLALELGATIMLFRADARAWFAARGQVIDPDVFG
jgi:hypothetical protein